MTEEVLDDELVVGKEEGAARLYDVNALWIAVFLGSGLAGGALLAINARRLGNAIAEPIAIGVATTALGIGLGFALPELPAIGNSCVQLGLLYAYFRVSTQHRAIGTHLAAGGELASRWKAAGIGLAAGALLFGLLFAWAFLFPEAALEG